jgi:SAM-dependent methyltransferase
MLAPRKIPQQYFEWNQLYGAPFGFRNANCCRNSLLRKWHLIDVVYKWDPFAFQRNSTTRLFEYPWAFHVYSPPKGRVLEVGGGMSGFQFVLSDNGCHVVNVDPGQKELLDAWSYSTQDFAELNNQFGTNVIIRSTTIDKAGLEDNSFDCAYCISVLEHVPPAAMSSIMKHVWQCLKPGSRFVLTVDLFLNLNPFTRRSRNEYGENVNIKQLISHAPFVLEQGNADEMFGFDEFDPKTILSNLETYLIGSDYPVLAQCLVLRKPT